MGTEERGVGETAVTVLPRPRGGSDQTPGGRTECLDFRGAGCRKGRGQKVITGQQTCPPLPSVIAEGVLADILGGWSVKTADSMLHALCAGPPLLQREPGADAASLSAPGSLAGTKEVSAGVDEEGNVYLSFDCPEVTDASHFTWCKSYEDIADDDRFKVETAGDQ